MANIYIFDNRKNHALLSKGVALSKKARELNKQAEVMANHVERLTEADILVAAKLSGLKNN